ncbi:hypothetical protein ACVWXN_002704 [Bradyrhizobium sp. i1.4.4]
MEDPEVRATISEGTRAARGSDPAWRQRVSDLTKAGMADPAVRKMISDRTKAGMAARAAIEQAELAMLIDAWKASSAAVRRRFLAKLADATSIESDPP